MAGGVSGASGNNPIQGKNDIKASGTQKSNGAGNVPMADANRDVTAEEQAKKKQDAAKARLTENIKNGDALYNQTSPIGWFGQVIDGQKVGSEIIITGIPEGTTLGQVSAMYNLPAGSLRHNSAGGGGNFNLHKVCGGTVSVHVDHMAQGLGITTDALKDMFPDEAFSNWHFGTGK
jgi:hypothetical protein